MKPHLLSSAVEISLPLFHEICFRNSGSELEGPKRKPWCDSGNARRITTLKNLTQPCSFEVLLMDSLLPIQILARIAKSLINASISVWNLNIWVAGWRSDPDKWCQHWDDGTVEPGHWESKHEKLLFPVDWLVTDRSQNLTILWRKQSRNEDDGAWEWWWRGS